MRCSTVHLRIGASLARLRKDIAGLISTRMLGMADLLDNVDPIYEPAHGGAA
jgi:hypothetical protein